MSNYDLLALLATLCGTIAAATLLRSGKGTPSTAPCSSRRTRRGSR